MQERVIQLHESERILETTRAFVGHIICRDEWIAGKTQHAGMEYMEVISIYQCRREKNVNLETATFSEPNKVT